MPLELYDVTVSITAFEPNRHIEWTILAAFLNPPIGHVYEYSLEPSKTFKWSEYFRDSLATRSRTRSGTGQNSGR